MYKSFSHSELLQLNNHPFAGFLLLLPYHWFPSFFLPPLCFHSSSELRPWEGWTQVTDKPESKDVM